MPQPHDGIEVDVPPGSNVLVEWGQGTQPLVQLGTVAVGPSSNSFKKTYTVPNEAWYSRAGNNTVFACVPTFNGDCTSGDPRRISQGLNKVKQEASLDGVRRNVGGLLLFNDSKTESLQKLQKGEIPGELSFFLVGLVAALLGAGRLAAVAARLASLFASSSSFLSLMKGGRSESSPADLPESSEPPLM